MKPFAPRRSTAPLLPVMVAALCLLSSLPARAQYQSPGGSDFYQQGDEMSRRVGNFFRRLFYGEDRGPMDAPGGYPPPQGYPPQRYQQPQGYPPPQYPQQGYGYYQQPYRGAPPPGMNYQYAPPPVYQGNEEAQDGRPRQEKRQWTQDSPPSTRNKSNPPRGNDTDRPRRRDSSGDVSRSSSKKPGADSASKRNNSEEPAKRSTSDNESKTSSKRKSSYRPSTPSQGPDDPPQGRSNSKTSENQPRNTVLKAPVQDQPPAPKKKEPEAQAKYTPPTPPPPTKEESTEGLSPYADGYGGKSSGTLKAPQQPKTEEKPKTDEKPKKDGTSSTASSSPEAKFPVGTKSPTRADRVVSPYPPHNELDVSGLPSGSLAVDPTTSKVFRVP